MDSESIERPVNRPSTTDNAPLSSDPLGSALFAPNRPTCDSCRRRKVKCDRQQPCSVCNQSNSDCVYPSRRGRAPKKSRRGVDAQLADRLSHLDTLIKRFEEQTAANHPPLDSNQLESPKTGHSADRCFGRLIVDNSRSYYVSNDLWGSLASEITELRGILLEPATEDENDDGNHPFLDYLYESSSLGSNGAIFGFRAIAHSLRPYHPSASQSAALFSLFTDNVAPLIRIFHMPTLCGIYKDAIASLNTLDADTEALLFAIYYSAVISTSSDQCMNILGAQRSTALAHNRFLVEQALARAEFLNTQSTMLLQAAVLFVSSFRNQDDSRTSWSLTTLIFHIAQAMGLHRDGKLFNLSPFKTEIRRRLWWQICILDSRGSEYHGYEPIVHGGETSFDTRLPLHVNDSDLHPDMVDEPAERWDMATDMTLTLIRCEAMRTGWKFSQMYPKLQMIPVEGVRKVSVKDHEALVRELQQTLEDKYLSRCDASAPYQLVSFAVGRLVISRFWLVVHYPSNRKDGKETTLLDLDLDAEMRDRLFSASIEILEWTNVLLNKEDLAKWTWYAKTHIQWHTMAFVLSELCSRPPSPEYDKAWACITTVYGAWERERSEKDIMSGPIRQLMARARYVQQMQQVYLHQGQENQHLSLADVGCHPYTPLELSGPQLLSVSNLVWPPGAFSLHDVHTNTLEEVFRRATLDPCTGLLPELPSHLFRSLVGSEESSQSMYDQNTMENWDAF